MITLDQFPALNASLNALTAVFLAAGFFFVRNKQINAHRNAMTCALLTSTIFLSCYLYYHFYHGATRFGTPGWPKTIYFTILISHTILAVVVLPLIIAAVYYAIRGQFETHKKFTRWAWPIWMYVSVTGVVIYFLLYQIYPQK